MFFVLIIFFLPLFATVEAHEDTTDKNLKSFLASMPIEDKIELENLFRLLMADGDFAYTLFGDKPVAFSDFFVDFEKCGFFYERSSFNYLSAVYKGLLVWQKYETFFPLSSFNLMTYVTQEYNLIGFVLYHKQKVKTLYDKHQPLMKNVFGDADRIAPLICGLILENLKFVDDKNLYHEAVGLLLGYDETNVQRFSKRYELMDALAMGPFALEGLNSRSAEGVLQRLDEKVHTSLDSKEFRVADIIHQLNCLSDTKVVSLSLRDETLSPMRIPKYGAIEGEREVVARQKAYDTVRDKIAEIFFSENFLEIILSQLQS